MCLRYYSRFNECCETYEKKIYLPALFAKYPQGCGHDDIFLFCGIVKPR